MAKYVLFKGVVVLFFGFSFQIRCIEEFFALCVSARREGGREADETQ